MRRLSSSSAAIASIFTFWIRRAEHQVINTLIHCFVDLDVFLFNAFDRKSSISSGGTSGNTLGEKSANFARHEIEAVALPAFLIFKMADNNLSDEILETLSADIDKLFKDVELKYCGILPWEAVSEKLAVQDFFRSLSRAKENAIFACSSRYTREEKLASNSFASLHNMACSELLFWTKSIHRRMHFTVKHSHP